MSESDCQPESSEMATTFTRVLQFKITLSSVKPPIWRRIQVPGNYTFWDLHVATQDAMGWTDTHLHCFRFGKRGRADYVEIGIPDGDGFGGSSELLSGWEVPVRAYITSEKPRAEYDYDFGDDWRHVVVLEKTLPRIVGVAYPNCLAGRRACPPEDCGGAPGYERLLAVFADPSHPEIESVIEWIGAAFSPEDFRPDAVVFNDPRKRWQRVFGE